MAQVNSDSLLESVCCGSYGRPFSRRASSTEAVRVQTSFKTGDKAVYPGQGVGEVMGIEHTEAAGQRQSFYVLRILENGMRIMIPINKLGTVGLRENISEEDVKQAYTILKEKNISID